MGNLGDWIGVFLIIAVLFGNGGLFGGGNDTQAQINAAMMQNGQRDILLSSANNNYETAQLINAQTRDYMLQNQTNQLAVVNGFNAIQATLAGISSQIGSCCCDIKTTLLQDKYDAAIRENARLLADKSNADQSAYLLSVMGKWVANPAAA
jgi:hypothetical protein